MTDITTTRKYTTVLDVAFETEQDLVELANIAAEYNVTMHKLTDSGPSGWPTTEVTGELSELRKFLAWYFETTVDEVDEFIDDLEEN